MVLFSYLFGWELSRDIGEVMVATLRLSYETTIHNFRLMKVK